MYQLPPLPTIEALPDRPSVLPTHRRRDLDVSRGQLTLLGARRHPVFLTLGIAMLMWGLAFAILPWGTYARDQRIAQDGASARATITRLEMITGDDGVGKYELFYTFPTADGAMVEGRSDVGRDGFGSLTVGETVRVVYDPSRPTTSYPLGNAEGVDGGLRSAWITTLFSAFGTLFVAGGLVVLWGLLVRLPESWRRLVQDGREVEGTVTRIEVGDRATSRVRLHYAYADRSGNQHQGVTEWVPQTLVADWQTGDPGIVHYERENMRESVWLGRGSLTFYR